MGWSAWQLDHVTVGWIVWIVFFVVWQTYALTMQPGNELTAHLRPVFAAAPIVWALGQTAVAWFWLHIFYPQWEAALIDWLSR